MITQIQWGNILLHLENKIFSDTFFDGRRHFFESIEEEPRRTAIFSDKDDLLHLVSLPSKKHAGSYCFDDEAEEGHLGFFLGYMSGPLYPETQEEQRQRIRDIEMLPIIALQKA